jgi:hypothetical protein
MNKEETIEAIKVMQAFVDGETITARPRYQLDSTTIAKSPAWNWSDTLYEVKPKPREAWVAFSECGRAKHVPIDKPDWKVTGYDYVLMREVTE